MPELTLVTLAHPCNACVIITQLARSVCQRLARELPFVHYAEITLADAREAKTVPGIEVESFPLVLLCGEQLTAGSIPDRRALHARIQSEDNHEI